MTATAHHALLLFHQHELLDLARNLDDRAREILEYAPTVRADRGQLIGQLDRLSDQLARHLDVRVAAGLDASSGELTRLAQALEGAGTRSNQREVASAARQAVALLRQALAREWALVELSRGVAGDTPRAA